jgi:hypothetical protein
MSIVEKVARMLASFDPEIGPDGWDVLPPVHYAAIHSESRNKEFWRKRAMQILDLIEENM